MQKLLLSLITIVNVVSFGQELPPLEAKGQIPEEFLLLSSKVHKEDHSASESESHFEKKNKKKFVEQNSYGLRELLFSGNIIFNDEVSVYINRVADKAFAHQPKLRKQLKFFTMKSTEVNAFATHNGLIFVTTGLVAQLESEAQLAMILCHEAIHYKNKHSINQYVENQAIVKGKGEYRKKSRKDRISSHYHYSKELETEADKEGLDIFKKSGYSTETIGSLFEILKYSHLPYDLAKFDTTFFNTEHYTLHSDLFLAEKDITEVNTKERDDEESTHPNAEKRKQAIFVKLKNTDNSNKEEFLVSKADFLNVRQQCRAQNSRILINDNNYEEAFYNAYLQLSANPDDLLARKSMAYTLYALTKFKNSGNFYEVHTLHTEVEGNWQQVFHMFDKMDAKELNTLAIKYNWNLAVETKFEDPLYNNICDTLFKEMYKTHELTIDDFYTKSKDELTKEEENSSEADTKITKIKSDLKHKQINYDYWRYAFIEELKNTAFTEKFQKNIDQAIAEQKAEEKRIAQINKKNRKKTKVTKGKGYALGIDKVVMLQPEFDRVDGRHGRGKQLKASEKAQLQLNDMVMKASKASNLSVDLLDDMGFKASDVTSYNDMLFLNKWFINKGFQIDNHLQLLSFDQNTLNDLMKRRNTEHFCWTGFSSIHLSKEGVGYYYLTSILYPPVLLYAVPYTFLPEYKTHFYMIVLNGKTNNLEWINYGKTYIRGSHGLVQSLIHDSFYQLHRTK